ncbi:MAG: MFS transporter [Bacteroidota bacterium]
MHEQIAHIKTIIPVEKATRYRWRICALLFFSVVIHYIDRQALSQAVVDDGFLRDTGLMGKDGRLNKELFGFLDASFKIAFMIGFLLMGNFLDRIGTRKGFSLAIFTWSLGGMGQAIAGSFIGFSITRFVMGIGEAGNFPASIKTVAEWFPRKERSLATGIFNTGSNAGIMIAPFFMVFFMTYFSWRVALFAAGSLGLIWLIFWWNMYRKPEEHSKVNRAELAVIQADPAEPVVKISWLQLFKLRQTWAFALGKFFTDPAWFLYLIWLPTFFKEEHNIALKAMVVPMMVIYLISAFGSIGGGWLSSSFLKNGWNLNNARKTTFFICALCALPAYFASVTADLWIAIPIIGLATAAHAGFSANLFTLVSDTFPKQAVASVVGIGGTFGAIGGVIISALSGVIYQKFGPAPLFLYGSLAYLVALVIIHKFNPKLTAVSAHLIETKSSTTANR